MNPLFLLLLAGGASATAVGGYVAYDRYQEAQKATVQAPATAETPQVVEQEVASVEPTAAPELTPDVETKPEETEVVVEPLEVPTFDLVRVEKNGDAVIAGQAVPNAQVFLENNGEVVGTTTADATGAFVIIPDKPFSGPNNEIQIRAKLEGRESVSSNQVVAVAVDGEKTPLVAVVEQGKPVNIVQQPEPEVQATEVAKAPEVSEPVEVPEPEPIVEIAENPEPLPETEVAVVQQEDAVAPEPELEVAALPEPEPEPIADDPQPATTPEPPKQVEAPAVTLIESQPELVVDAVETEDEAIFIAGSGEPNQIVRVYVNDQLLGDTKSGADGRWLLQETKKLEPGEYNVRADLLQSTGGVDARAAVPFVVSETERTRLVSLDPNQGQRVIIRKNDNLWTISQRLYGDGRRFTAIYQRNSDQIRDPNLIYPGQVFELPKDQLAPLQGPPGIEKEG